MANGTKVGLSWKISGVFNPGRLLTLSRYVLKVRYSPFFHCVFISERKKAAPLRGVRSKAAKKQVVKRSKIVYENDRDY